MMERLNEHVMDVSKHTCARGSLLPIYKVMQGK